MSWLRRQKQEPELAPEEAVPNRSVDPPYVPASMRPRPIVVPPALQQDDDADDDEQVAFLASLAQQIDGEAGLGDGSRGPTAPRGEGDDMWAFREKAVAFDPYEGVRRHVVDEVPIDELIDDLSMTAAALRRRRAA